MESKPELKKFIIGSKGVLSEIFILLLVLMGIGLYSLTFHEPMLTMISGSSVYGIGTELNLLFVGIGAIILVVVFYSLFFPRPQQSF